MCLFGSDFNILRNLRGRDIHHSPTFIHHVTDDDPGDECFSNALQFLYETGSTDMRP